MTQFEFVHNLRTSEISLVYMQSCITKFAFCMHERNRNVFAVPWHACTASRVGGVVTSGITWPEGHMKNAILFCHFVLFVYRIKIHSRC